MNNDGVVIGIDTSNYTTSVALLDTDGRLIANIKEPLPVKTGERGLRQSDALFAHVKNIPEVMKRARAALGERKILAIGVSERPRNVEGSYMPCFLAGVSAAESIGAATGKQVYRFSHQCGHVMAAVYSSDCAHLLSSEFAALHISGGTTELLLVKKSDSGFDTRIVGGTKDLNAGQLVDRVGVYMGIGFPCGPQMEKLALATEKRVKPKRVTPDGCYVNLSGLENQAVKLYNSGEEKGTVAAFVFESIGLAIKGMCTGLVSECGNLPFVFAGGVMCNSIIKNMLASEFNAYFAEPAMSSDNAVGIAALTLDRLKNN